jgi:predicted nucleotidyltransferase
MSTIQTANVSETILGKTRASVLSALFLQPGPSMYTREIIRATGGSPGAVQRELKTLEDLGLLIREERGNQVHYRANPQHPIYEDLYGLLVKTTGVADFIRNALEPLKQRIEVAFLYGSLARGALRASSDVDLMVIGRATFQEVSDHLYEAEGELRREVNPTVYPPSEFRKRIHEGHHFLSAVLRNEKVMLIGSENELRDLAGQPMAD